MVKIKELEDARAKALVENSAQAIFNILKDLENFRSLHEKRWVYELLQNGIDSVSEEGKVNCTIILENDNLIFAHDGNPFKADEVAHLIYHGSSKTKEPGQTGKFGKGFLTTHLVSRNVKVEGCLDDGRKFVFTLDRSGQSAEDIEKKMERAWSEFASLKSGFHEEQTLTRYTYEKINGSTAKSGIEDLTKNIPYVLAFAGKLGSVTLSQNGETIRWEKLEQNPLGQETNIFIVKILQVKNEINQEISVAVSKGNGVSVAVLLVKENEKLVVKTEDEIPKIFINFPLWGTSHLLPVVVNSPKFVPREQRDGISFGKEETEDNKMNKQLIREALNLFLNLVKCGAKQHWGGLHGFAHIGNPPERDWLQDSGWLKERLKEVINSLRGISIMHTQKGEWISPTNSYIPVLEDQDKLIRFWELAAVPLSAVIPHKNIFSGWAHIIKQWAELFGQKIDDVKEALTIKKFAKIISETGSLSKLQEKLNYDSPSETTKWLNSSLELIESEDKALLDRLTLLPNQNLDLQTTKNLFVDDSIDNELKNIADKISASINRGSLLHTDITSTTIKDILPKKSESDVLSDVVRKIKEKAERKQIDEQFIVANTNLFKWLVKKEKWEILRDNYPVLCYGKRDEINLSHLSKDRAMLPPIEQWDEKARDFVDIFPPLTVLASDYKLDKPDYWEKLQEEKILLPGPLYQVERELKEEELRCLLSEGTLSEDQDHASTLTVSEIPFLEAEKGILDTTRKNKEKARRFLHFLIRYVIAEDRNLYNPVETACICGSHKIYPVGWFWKVKSNKWVYVRRNKADPPSVENLARLVEEDKELQEKFKEENCTKFMNRLGISVADLMKAIWIKDEWEKQQVDMAFTRMLLATLPMGYGSKQLGEIAENMESNPDFLQKIQERSRFLQRLAINQKLGRDVEEIVRGILVGEGLNVKTAFKGYDISVYDKGECDVESDVGTVEVAVENREPSLYIEVKTTKEDRTRMTPKQVETAVYNKEKYVLCIVNLKEEREISALIENHVELRKRINIIKNIGNLLQPHYGRAQIAMSEQGGDIYLEVEKQRYVIRNPIWERHGKDFDAWINEIKEELLRG